MMCEDELVMESIDFVIDAIDNNDDDQKDAMVKEELKQMLHSAGQEPWVIAAAQYKEVDNVKKSTVDITHIMVILATIRTGWCSACSTIH